MNKIHMKRVNDTSRRLRTGPTRYKPEGKGPTDNGFRGAMRCCSLPCCLVPCWWQSRDAVRNQNDRQPEVRW